MKTKIIFLDRDGVINTFPGMGNYVTSPEQMALVPGAAQAIARLTRAGYEVYVISNQGCVSRKIITREILDRITQVMVDAVEREGGKFSGIFYCEHQTRDACECKKPKIGLFKKALSGKQVSVDSVYFVGDSQEDIEAAKNCGCRSLLVLSGRLQPETLAALKTKPDVVKTDLAAAVDWILKKKVRIYHATAGHGHVKAAEAVFEACRTKFPDADIQCVDAIAPAYFVGGWFYRWIYFFQIQRLPWVWGFFYYLTDKSWFYPLIRWPRRFHNALVASKLGRALVQENPDVVVSTHFLSTEVAGYLKKKGKISSKLITVVTDYLPHWVWMDEAVDEYVVALDETKRILVARGVPESKINVFGIPVDKKFAKNGDRKAVCQQFGLRSDCFTVLVTSGGAGIDSLRLIVEGVLKLGEAIQLLVVCGTNRSLYETLSEKAKKYPELHVFSFVNNMDELMDAADLVVGKAGGLTVTESLVKGKPMVLFRSVPGQEGRNTFCVSLYQAGFSTNSVEAVIQQIRTLFGNPQLFESIRLGVKRMAKPGSADKIAALI